MAGVIGMTVARQRNETNKARDDLQRLQSENKQMERLLEAQNITIKDLQQSNQQMQIEFHDLQSEYQKLKIMRKQQKGSRKDDKDKKKKKKKREKKKKSKSPDDNIPAIQEESSSDSEGDWTDSYRGQWLSKRVRQGNLRGERISLQIHTTKQPTFKGLSYL